MRVLALGGIRSGKSQWAEASIAQRSAPTSPSATWPPARLAPTTRTGRRGWPPTGNAGLRTGRPSKVRTWQRNCAPTPTAPTLVDDIGGWLVAAMDRHGAWTGGSVRRDVDDLVDAVGAFDGPLVLVSPEVGLTVVPATESGRLFADELGDAEPASGRRVRTCRAGDRRAAADA